MAKSGWARLNDDRIYTGEIELPFNVVGEKGVAVEFRDLLESHGFKDGTDITDVAALIAVERPDMVERLADDYDEGDIQAAKEACQQRYESESAREILDGFATDDIPIDELDADAARKLKSQFIEAAEGAADDESATPHEDILDNYPE